MTWVNLFSHELRVSLRLSQFNPCLKYFFPNFLCSTVCIHHTQASNIAAKPNPPDRSAHSVCREKRSMLLVSVASSKSRALLSHLTCITVAQKTCKKHFSNQILDAVIEYEVLKWKGNSGFLRGGQLVQKFPLRGVHILIHTCKLINDLIGVCLSISEMQEDDSSWRIHTDSIKFKLSPFKGRFLFPGFFGLNELTIIFLHLWVKCQQRSPPLILLSLTSLQCFCVSSSVLSRFVVRCAWPLCPKAIHQTSLHNSARETQWSPLSCVFRFQMKVSFAQPYCAFTET